MLRFLRSRLHLPPHSMAPPTRAQNRLQHVLSTLQPSTAEQSRELLGTLRIGELALPIYETDDPARLARAENLLDHQRDGEVVEHVEWMMRKAVLGAFPLLFGLSVSFSAADRSILDDPKARISSSSALQVVIHGDWRIPSPPSSISRLRWFPCTEM